MLAQMGDGPLDGCYLWDRGCQDGEPRMSAGTIDASQLPYFEVHDAGNGPHVLLLHGFLSSRAQWRPNLAGLTPFCRPVVVELLGHGRSPAPEDPQAYTIDNYLAAFEAIRRKVGAESWFVCGQSFGAGLVIQYALRHPKRVPGLIFTNSLSAMTPKGNPDREAQQQQRIDAIKAGGREGLESIRIHPRHAKRLPEDAKRELVADAATDLTGGRHPLLADDIAAVVDCRRPRTPADAGAVGEWHLGKEVPAHAR